MTVVLLSSDLTALARIEGAATGLGKNVRIVSSSPKAVECCNAERPDVLVVDLSLPSLDIAGLVDQLKSNEGAATRIVAFGPHVHEARLSAAREAGCDVVVSRGQFFSQLDSILKT